MGRRELREQIFLLLFRVEFNDPAEMPAQIQMFFETDNYEDEAVKWTEKDTTLKVEYTGSWVLPAAFRSCTGVGKSSEHSARTIPSLFTTRFMNTAAEM